MDRRSAIKNTTALAGLGFSSAFISGVLTGCKPDSIGTGYEPIFFDREKFEFLQSLSEVLIPETDTPGAIELGLAEWIDTIVSKCYTDDNQKTTSSMLDAVFNSFQGKATVKKVEDIEATEPIDANYQHTKRAIGTAYIATEYVGKELLNYLPIPGAYEACIPISETNGKAWTI